MSKVNIKLFKRFFNKSLYTIEKKKKKTSLFIFKINFYQISFSENLVEISPNNKKILKMMIL